MVKVKYIMMKDITFKNKIVDGWDINISITKKKKER